MGIWGFGDFGRNMGILVNRGNGKLGVKSLIGKIRRLENKYKVLKNLIASLLSKNEF